MSSPPRRRTPSETPRFATRLWSNLILPGSTRAMWWALGSTPAMPFAVMRSAEWVIEEVVQLRRQGLRSIALAADNSYPVTWTDLRLAERQTNQGRLQELRAIREERFELMACLAEVPSDMVFYTQTTMEAA